MKQIHITLSLPTSFHPSVMNASSLNPNRSSEHKFLFLLRDDVKKKVVAMGGAYHKLEGEVWGPTKTFRFMCSALSRGCQSLAIKLTLCNLIGLGGFWKKFQFWN